MPRTLATVGRLARITALSTAGAGLALAAEEHGLSQQAVEIARPLGLPVTNSMLVTWIVAVVLIVFARLATRDMRSVPTGAQNFLEWLVEGLYAFLEGIIGPHLVKRTFWFFATIFIFILSANWIGLVVYLVAAIVVSAFADAARSRAEEAELRRRQADEAVDGGRPADRHNRFLADRAGHEICCNRCRRTGTRHTRLTFGVVRITKCAAKRTACSVHCIFGQVRLGQNDRAGISQPFDKRRIIGRPVVRVFRVGT